MSVLILDVVSPRRGKPEGMNPLIVVIDSLLLGAARNFRNHDGIAVYVSSETDGLPGMIGQRGKALVGDVVYLPSRNKHELPTGLDASQRAIALDRKSTRLNSSHIQKSRMPSSA